MICSLLVVYCGLSVVCSFGVVSCSWFVDVCRIFYCSVLIIV